MDTQQYLGDGEMVLVTGDRTMRVNVKNAVMEFDIDNYAISSDMHMSPVARYTDTNYYIKALLVPDDNGRFGTITVNEAPRVAKVVGAPRRVYTTVTDMSILSIRTAAEAVGASEDDVFEVQEEDSGEYRLTWEL